MKLLFSSALCKKCTKLTLDNIEASPYHKTVSQQYKWPDCSFLCVSVGDLLYLLEIQKFMQVFLK
jgi:hypothetical protein